MDSFQDANRVLRGILDAIPMCIYWKDTSLNYQGANKAFLNQLQVSSTDELSMSNPLAGPDPDIDKQVLETGITVSSSEEQLVLPHGRTISVNFMRVPLHSADGTLSGVLGTWMDVSENIQFRDQLRQRKDFLARLVQALPVGFFAKDPSSGYSYRIWNRKMEDIFGYSAESAVDSRDWNLFGALAAQQLEKDDREVLADPDRGTGTRLYKLPGKHGMKTVSVVRVPLFDDLLDTTLVAGVVDDVTRETQLEEQLLQAQKMEAIGRLAGGVAHDFNNLLQVIMGAAEIGSSSADLGKSSFEQILKAGEKAMFLTRQLLTFSREETFNRRVFQVDPRVGDFVDMVQRIVEENISLTFVPGASGLSIKGDPFQLEQVLMNLIVNARDALENEANGRITVSTGNRKEICQVGSDPEDCVVVSVSDNGEGIHPEIVNRIFEPFFTTKTETKGTGLGLASSYAIITKHYGTIRVESMPGEGTRFDVCIPVSSGLLDNAGESEDSGSRGDNRRKLTILLAEDEEMVREVARTLLQRAGHLVLETSDGESAVEMFRKHGSRIDLLLFDAMMPRMSGKEAFQIIHGESPKLPCIFCTGYSGESLMGLFRGKAKVRVLQKPYSAVKLLEVVEDITSGN